MAQPSQNTTPPDHLVNPANPFYLHPGENPAVVLVSPPLTETNFHQWQREMLVALETKNKERFVNGSLHCPPINDPLHDAWRRSNRMVMSWMIRSMTPSIKQSVMWMDTAVEIWNDLKERFSHSDKFRVADLQDQITHCKQGESSVSEYYTRLKILWKEIELYRCVLVCTCSTSCSCGLLPRLQKEREDDCVIRFLRGLNDDYSQVRSQVMMMDPMPSIIKTFSMILQHEREFVSTSSSTQELVAFSVQSKEPHKPNNNPPTGSVKNANLGKSNRNNKFCEKCKKTNHTIETCYWRIGFPTGYRKTSRQSSGASSASLVEAETDTSPPQSQLVEEATPDQFSFSKEQYTALLALLQQSQVNTASTHSPPNHSANSAGDLPPFTPWILDSGATDHMCPSKTLFQSLKPIFPIHIKLPNNTTVTAKFSGNIILGNLTLLNVLYVPDFVTYLISIPKLLSHSNCMVVFFDTKCLILQKCQFRMIGAARYCNGLFYLQPPSGVQSCHSFSHNIVGSSALPTLWHHRLGHTSDRILKHLSTKYSDIDFHCSQPCDTCHFAKQKKLPFPHSNRKSSSFFELIHVDVWGPVAISSIDGFKYFLTVVDDFRRFTWIHLLKYKSDVKTILPSFIQLIETQFTVKLKRIRSDNGKEFYLTDFFNNKGIFHETSCVETPQQNSIVERKHQHLLNVSRALLFQAHLPTPFWSFAVKHATHLINRLPSPLLHFKSPYELIHGNLPDLTHLRVFGCLAFATTLFAGRTKFDKRAVKTVFLGVKPGTKGFILYDIVTKSTFISRNVIFYENSFPYNHKNTDTQHAHINNFPISTISDMDRFSSLIPFENSDDYGTENNSFPQHALPTQNVENVSQDSQQATDCFHRQSTRSKKPPAYLADYHCPTIALSNTTHTTPYPLISYMSYANCSNPHTAFSLSISGTIDPTSFKEANQLECWQNAMLAELEALDKNKTWSLVPLPPDKKAVGCRWVYRTKFNADGTIQRHKARLVAKGFTQTEGVDFFETFSPVVKLTTVRFILSLAVSSGWFLYQLDVDNAFLHGELNEEVFMKPPPGMRLPSPKLVCKLHKSLYGLRQSSRQWNAKLTAALINYGFTQSMADYSLFVQKTDDSFTVLLVYVDDIVLTGNNLTTINHIKAYLHSQFHIKDLGNLKYFLGFEVARSRRGLVLHQRKYCLDILSEFGLTGCKPAPTPTNSSGKINETEGNLLPDPTHYRRLVGKLLYLTHTRPDISFAVQQISQFMASPRVSHLHVAFRILRYLKNAPGTGLFYPVHNRNRLQAFSDSDWATCSTTRRSITGYCIFYGDCLISWKSKKQNTVS